MRPILGKGARVFVIAEISANHCQSFNRAVKLIKEAKSCGADSVKFQLYTPDTLTLDVNNKYFKIRHSKWKGQTLYQLYKKAYTPWSWFKRLKKIAQDQGLVFFATAYDKTSVDFLEKLGVDIHKIASFELVDIPLIKYMAKTKKPLLISSGMAAQLEIKEALTAARTSGAKEVVLLKCVSSYPASPSEMNLRTIPHMRKAFKVEVGLSDHTLGIAVAVAAVSLGAVVVEKHFTLSRSIKSPDSFFSLEPSEFKQLVENLRVVEKALGEVSYKLTPGQKKSKVFRRSLFVTKDIKRGLSFSEDNIRSVRPSYGLKPKYLEDILGKKARRALKRGSPLTFKDVA
ncbi:MAG: pseudaminic acid synthase [Candidatus Omnitrophica bacterium]|nr:pseudaminic acid synthase [Candidatus Omnitrophota bacterium]